MWPPSPNPVFAGDVPGTHRPPEGPGRPAPGAAHRIAVAPDSTSRRGAPGPGGPARLLARAAGRATAADEPAPQEVAEEQTAGGGARTGTAAIGSTPTGLTFRDGC